MSLMNVRARAVKAPEKLLSAVRKAQAASGSFVLVVYGEHDANIYYEGTGAQLKPAPRGC